MSERFNKSHQEQHRFRKVAPIAMVVLTLSACGGSSPKSTTQNIEAAPQTKAPEFAEDDSKPTSLKVSQFVNQEIASNLAKACLGKALIKDDGAIRSEPTVNDGYGNTPSNYIDIAFAPFENRVIQDPVRIITDGYTYDDVKPYWYMFQYGEHKVGFVNEVALQSNNMVCEAQASTKTTPGPLTIEHK